MTPNGWWLVMVECIGFTIQKNISNCDSHSSDFKGTRNKSSYNTGYFTLFESSLFISSSTYSDAHSNVQVLHEVHDQLSTMVKTQTCPR